MGLRCSSRPWSRSKAAPKSRSGPGPRQELCFLADRRAGTGDLLAHSVRGREIRVGSWGFMVMLAICLSAIRHKSGFGRRVDMSDQLF